MDVPGVGAGPTAAEVVNALRAMAGPKGHPGAAPRGPAQPGDAVGDILRQLSEPGVVKFLEAIERPPSRETAARIDGLLQASIAAVAEGHVPQALAKLVEFAALDPRRAEALVREPGLTPIRREVDQLVSRLGAAAHMDAESRLSRATHLLGLAESRAMPQPEDGSKIAILVAGRLLEAGGYANCIRSAQVSQTLINQYGLPPIPVPLEMADAQTAPLDFEHALAGFRQRLVPWFANLWRRAPLLILLLAWLAAGFVGGSLFAFLHHWWPETWPGSMVSGGFDLWGVGFLALVGFGFYARVRNVR